MIYSIGDEANLRELCWSSDWDSKEILGEDYPHDFVVGLYSEPFNKGEMVSYYIDLRSRTVMTIFIEKFGEEDVETIWNEEYLLC